MPKESIRTRRPRVAAIILAHDNPNQVLKLVEKLQDPRIQVYIHLDKKANQTEFNQHLTGLSFIWLNPRFDISWGSFEMIRCTLEALKTVSSSELNHSHIALLSGACMPLIAAHDIVAFLEAHPNTAFMDCNPVICIPEFQDRHTLQWYRFGRGKLDLVALPYWQTPNRKSLWLMIQFGLKLCSKLELKSIGLVKNAFRNAPELKQGAEVKIGTQWWVLTGKNAIDIASFLKRHTWFTDYFKYSKIPDESFFQTLLPLMAQRGYEVSIRPSLTYTRWIENTPSPEWLDALTCAERESIVKQGYIFARKFKKSSVW